MKAFVRAVVLNYNGGDLVLDCLRALAKTEWDPERFEVVVVDNASTDGSDHLIEQELPSMKLIRVPKNEGFPANNLALIDRAFDYVALVNNDAFVSPGWLEPLVCAMEADRELGAVCPKIVFAPRFVDLELSTESYSPPGDERVLGLRLSGLEVDAVDRWQDTQFPAGFWHPEAGVESEPWFRWTAPRATLRVPIGVQGQTAGRVRLRVAAESSKPVTLASGGKTLTTTIGTAPGWIEFALDGVGYDVINNVGSVLIEGGWGADRGYLERDSGQYDTPTDVFAWCGGGVLLRREYLDDVGLLDERFFLYYEDFDLSWRGQSRGWRYRYVPGPVIRHVHAASSGEGSALFQHYVERNRLLMLAKNAPIRLIVTAVYGFLRATGSYAVRDAIRPMMRGRRPNLEIARRRVASLLGFARLLPVTVRERRRIRRRQLVDDRRLLGWAVPR